MIYGLRNKFGTIKLQKLGYTNCKLYKITLSRCLKLLEYAKYRPTCQVKLPQCTFYKNYIVTQSKIKQISTIKKFGLDKELCG